MLNSCHSVNEMQFSSITVLLQRKKNSLDIMSGKPGSLFLSWSCENIWELSQLRRVFSGQMCPVFPVTAVPEHRLYFCKSTSRLPETISRCPACCVCCLSETTVYRLNYSNDGSWWKGANSHRQWHDICLNFPLSCTDDKLRPGLAGTLFYSRRESVRSQNCLLLLTTRAFRPVLKYWSEESGIQ